MHVTSYRQGAFLFDLVTGWLTAIGEADSIAVVTAHEAYSPEWCARDNVMSCDVRWCV